jgi:hypothetical protein
LEMLAQKLVKAHPGDPVIVALSGLIAAGDNIITVLGTYYPKWVPKKPTVDAVAPTRKVLGGGVTLVRNVKATATVEVIDFKAPVNVPVVPNGTTGTMTLTAPPAVVGCYTVGDDLHYQDSNRNNDSTLHIDTVIGPSKYGVTKKA